MDSWTMRFLLAGAAFLMMTLCAAAPKPPAPSHGWLLVANKGDHTLGIIDPEEGKQIRTEEFAVTGAFLDIPLPEVERELALRVRLV